MEAVCYIITTKTSLKSSSSWRMLKTHQGNMSPITGHHHLHHHSSFITINQLFRTPTTQEEFIPTLEELKVSFFLLKMGLRLRYFKEMTLKRQKNCWKLTCYVMNECRQMNMDLDFLIYRRSPSSSSSWH